jgi:DNA repair exonuclease SbcCD ATPase subunit
MTRLLLLMAILTVLPTPARAQQPVQQVETLWNCKDKDGRTILTNQQSDTIGRDCRIVHQQRVTVVPAAPAPKPPAKAASPAGFPKESPSDRLAAKAKQRETLERELEQEQQMLAEAKRKLAEQEAIRTGDEKNYARVLERLKPYRDAVEVHEKNIEALKRELANLYR